MRDYEKIRIIAEGLISEYDHCDPDYIAAEPFINEIIDLLASSYDYSGFCEWLAEKDGDILLDFRYSDIRERWERSDYDDEDEF